MKELLRSTIIKCLPKGVLYEIIKPYKDQQVYFSQEGEDIILDRILGQKLDGFYVDIGAHHPLRFSNTYKFYLKGWSGINIDAMPGSMVLFNNLRPRDINIEIGITKEISETKFYVFKENAINTFDRKLAEAHLVNNAPPSEVSVKTSPLSVVLDQYLPKNQKIDFMTIDVEGYDLDVLESNDWEKYSPEVILIESLHQEIKDIPNSPINLFLSTLGFKAFAKTYNTLFFRK